MPMTRKVAAAFVLGLSLSACYAAIDTTDRTGLAFRPTGTVGRITLMSGSYFYGELLAVLDSGLVVVRAGQVAFVGWTNLDNTAFVFPKVTLDARHAPTASAARALTLASRFPQGLTRDVERRLLAAYHQADIVVLGP